MLLGLSFCEVPVGHSHVLKGFEILQQHRENLGIFDAWLKDLEQTVDGRGKMGSLVGASDEMKRLGVYNAPDGHLMEYAVSDFIIYIYIYVTNDFYILCTYLFSFFFFF